MSKTRRSWHDGDDDSRGLSGDLTRLLQLANRRRVLRLLAGAALLPLLRCGSDAGSDLLGGTTDDSSATNDDTTSDGSCAKIPEETQGPYPADGSNGPNALTLSGIVREDITSSIAGVTGTAYLRGVQESGDDGKVSFTTVFPGCYDGRMPHVHFEIYPTLDSATKAGNKLATSQLAFPRDVCDSVYATAGYESSVGKFAKTSFAKDMVFADGVNRQLTTITGDVNADLTSSLTVAING